MVVNSIPSVQSPARQASKDSSASNVNMMVVGQAGAFAVAF